MQSKVTGKGNKIDCFVIDHKGRKNRDIMRRMYDTLPINIA